MIVKAISFLMGLFDALGRAEELQMRLAIVLHVTGITSAVLAGYFNPDWAVNSIMALLVDYLIGAIFGEFVGGLLKATIPIKLK